jgi:hypothetical protein
VAEISDIAMTDRRSETIVEAALRRSQTDDDGAINRWLMQEFAG